MLHFPKWILAGAILLVVCGSGADKPLNPFAPTNETKPEPKKPAFPVTMRLEPGERGRDGEQRVVVHLDIQASLS